MSNDTVDDLHAAEDFAGSCAALLADLVEAFHEGGPGALDDVVTRAAAKVGEWSTYCRPCCGWLDSTPHECDEGGADVGCACPCDHPVP